jgi:hypothetical protein
MYAIRLAECLQRLVFNFSPRSEGANFDTPRGLFTPVDRVTRLGENSPKGRLFTIGSFSNITKVAQIFGLLFSACKSSALILTKTLFGYILGDFYKLVWSPCL